MICPACISAHPSNSKRKKESKMIQTRKYARKTFYVEAVEVTEENMAEVAEWCGGAVRTEGPVDKPTSFIKVKVHNSLSDRQTKAYVGDRVLQNQDRNGFKVFTPNAFANAFEPVEITERG